MLPSQPPKASISLSGHIIEAFLQLSYSFTKHKISSEVAPQQTQCLNAWTVSATKRIREAQPTCIHRTATTSHFHHHFLVFNHLKYLQSSHLYLLRYKKYNSKTRPVPSPHLHRTPPHIPKCKTQLHLLGHHVSKLINKRYHKLQNPTSRPQHHQNITCRPPCHKNLDHPPPQYLVYFLETKVMVAISLTRKECSHRREVTGKTRVR